jgi:predicted N-acetyltransferase YhbS
MIEGRELTRTEISSVFTIDRTERITQIYRLDDGQLELANERYDMRGWPPGEAEKYTPVLEACHDAGGWCYGLFDGDCLVAAAVLDGKPVGRDHQVRQLAFLHVSHSYRGRGLGKELFQKAAEEARRRGMRQLYISATPSRRTVDFYRCAGCSLAREPDPVLFAMEPEDIHLMYQL